MIKRITGFLLVIILGLFFIAPVTFAADSPVTCANGLAPAADGSCPALDPFAKACSAGTTDASTCTVDGSKNPISGKDGILSKVINIFSFIIGAASIIMILLGSIKYVTSAGNSNGISSARNTILYALIGIVVFLFSRAILAFVINRI